MKRNQQTRVEDELPVRKVGDVRRHRSFVVYGRSGTGKTTFAASFPKPMLYLDIKDRGTDSIADVDDIDVMEVNTFEDFEIAHEFLSTNPKKYKTVCVDTVSQLQTMLVKEYASDKKGNVARAGDWGSMKMKDWGNIAAVMKEWLGNYRDLTDLGINVVFIAQDRVFNGGDDEETSDESIAPEVGPALSPSIAKALNASVSMIGNTFIRERKIQKEVNGKKKVTYRMEYCLGIGPSSLYTRKFRKSKSIELPDVIVNPEYDDLIEIIKGE